MVSGKHRLYVALSTRQSQYEASMPGKEDIYHWSLLVGPKQEQDARGRRFHVKQTQQPDSTSYSWHAWQYEVEELPMPPIDAVLVRVLVAKIVNVTRLLWVLEHHVSVRQELQGWNSYWWVKGALEALEADGKTLGTAVLDWERVLRTVVWYVVRKEDGHRFDGLAEKGRFDYGRVATWDSIDGCERVA